MKWLTRKSARTPTWLIVGLGNPGPKFATSRHNVGFMFIDRWAKAHGIELSKRRPWGVIGEGQLETGAPQKVILLKPRTFMNLSGQAVREAVSRYPVERQRLLVVYDDLDLPLGKMRIRAKGSAGGHNGIKDIIGQLGTEDFARVRIGIGRPREPQTGAIDHVLGNFSNAERKAMEEALERTCAAVDLLLAEGIDRAMGLYNSEKTPAE